MTFHNTLVFMCSEKSDFIADNNHLEKFGVSILNIYCPIFTLLFQSQAPI